MWRPMFTLAVFYVHCIFTMTCIVPVFNDSSRANTGMYPPGMYRSIKPTISNQWGAILFTGLFTSNVRLLVQLSVLLLLSRFQRIGGGSGGR